MERGGLGDILCGMSRTLTTLIVWGLTIAYVAGCGNSSDGGYTPGPERSDEFIREAVDQANRRADFPLLWLGRSYRGYRFNEIDTNRKPTGGAPAADVIYGDCKIPSDQTEGGCGLPYEVQQRDACAGFPVAVQAHPRRRPDGTIMYSEGGGLVIVTGRTYVKIFGKGARTAAQQLRPLGRDEPSGGLRPAAACVPNVARLHARRG